MKPLRYLGTCAKRLVGVLLTSSVAMALEATPMAPMEQIGPRCRGVDLKAYAQVIRVGPQEKQRTVAGAVGAITDAAAGKRYAVLVVAGQYNESRIQMKPHVDLYGGFAGGDW